jgi:hypothetical protein
LPQQDGTQSRAEVLKMRSYLVKDKSFGALGINGLQGNCKMKTGHATGQTATVVAIRAGMTAKGE